MLPIKAGQNGLGPSDKAQIKRALPKKIIKKKQNKNKGNTEKRRAHGNRIAKYTSTLDIVIENEKYTHMIPSY